MNGAFFQSGYNNVYVSNSRSMARFGLLMLNQGNWNGTQIMTDTTYFNQMINTSQNLNLSYGYLWWLNGKSSFMVPTLQNVFPGQLFADAPADMYAALGKDGQIISVVPSENLVMIRMGESPGTSSEVTITYNNDIWKKLNDLTCNVSAIENQNQIDFKIYPNPAKDRLFIDSNSDIEKICLFNMTGQKVLELDNINTNNFSFELSDLPAASYFLQISNGAKVSISKLLIQP
jgi:CubicO group peptidase (beta-lactamase class C family)